MFPVLLVDCKCQGHIRLSRPVQDSLEKDHCTGNQSSLMDQAMEVGNGSKTFNNNVFAKCAQNALYLQKWQVKKLLIIK